MLNSKMKSCRFLKVTFVALITLHCICFCSGIDPLTICPPKDLIEPCECEKHCSTCKVTLLCKKITSQDVLMRVLDQSSDYAYERFDIKRSSIMYIPASIFATKKLTSIYVLYSSMVTIFDEAPPPDNDLEILSLNEAKMSRGLQWELLSTLKKLKDFTVMHTTVRRIDKSFVEYAPKKIQKLMIYNCSTVQLDDNAFAAMASLSRLSIQLGKIKVLKRSMFPSHAKLDSIDFNDNRIETLPEDLFTDMPVLTYIRFTKNLLSTVNENTFKSTFPKLHSLYLDSNPIKCRCNIRWITQVARRPDYIYGSCKEPKQLAGKNIGDLTSQDFIHCK